jgi:hypothetical protein
MLSIETMAVVRGGTVAFVVGSVVLDTMVVGAGWLGTVVIVVGGPWRAVVVGAPARVFEIVVELVGPGAPTVPTVDEVGEVVVDWAVVGAPKAKSCLAEPLEATTATTPLVSV